MNSPPADMALAVQLAQAARQPICQVDRLGRILDCNPAFTQATGWRPEQLRGQAWEDLCACPQEEARGGELGLGGWQQVDLRRADGGLMPGSWQRVGMGSPHEGCWLLGDAAVARVAASTAPAAPDRFVMAVEAARLGTWFFDLRRKQLQWNDVLRGHFGLPAGTPVDIDLFLRMLHPEDRSRVETQFLAALDQCGSFDCDYRVCGGDGIERTLHAFGQAFAGANGKTRLFDGITMDISDQRRTEQATHRALAVRDDFLAIASHELRTPLTGTLLHLHLLERRLRRADDMQAVHHFLRRLHQQMGRLTSLVDNMIDVSRISSASLQMAPRRCEINELAQQALAAAEKSLLQAKCQICFVSGAQPLFAFVDPQRLKQAIGNLLNNAAAYAPGSAVRVEVAADEAGACIRVADGGRGISAADLPRIMGKFERAIDRSEVSGMGLSLYITRHIMAALNGSLTAHSQLGHGATFALHLPVAGDL